MRNIRFFAAIAATVVTLVIAVLPISTASANTTYVSADQNSMCRVRLVHLHGSKPATEECLDKSKSTKNALQATPNTYGTQCGSASLLIESHDAFDLTLCFTGTGFVNMTDYLYVNFFNTWNDKAFWFQTGCNFGNFYIDTNGNGQRQGFTEKLPKTQFDGLQGRLPTWSLSSFDITSSLTSC